MAINLNSFQLQDTATLHLNDPAGNPMYNDEAETQPCTIEVYGRSSKVYRKWAIETQRKNELRGKKKKSAEESKAETADWLATCTSSVTNLALGDVALDNYDAYYAMYANDKLYWIGDQVVAIMGETADFLQK